MLNASDILLNFLPRVRGEKNFRQPNPNTLWNSLSTLKMVTSGQRSQHDNHPAPYHPATPPKCQTDCKNILCDNAEGGGMLMHETVPRAVTSSR